LLGLAVCTPAIVKASSLLPVRSVKLLNYGLKVPFIRLDVLYGTITLDEYAALVLAPMMEALVEKVAQDILTARTNFDWMSGTDWPTGGLLRVARP
jgi:hypothetical protein